jgi:peptidoglycan LD-endopeptidase LytH
MVQSARVRVLLVIVLGVSATLTAVWVLQKRFGYQASKVQTQPQVAIPQPQASPAPATPDTGLLVPAAPAPSSFAADPPPEEASPTPQPQTPILTLDPSYAARLNLVIPVKGVKREQLQDTFKDARSEGRVHDAIDILAPAGTPVIAAAEGEIIKLFESERGGITIYQLSKDKKLIFYYAHLQRYAEGLTVGKTVWQGETIAYVGDTGNAGTGNYHLHFSIMLTNNPKRYWEGTNINPYPLLRK